MTDNKEYEVGFEAGIEDILKEIEEEGTIPFEDLKKELNLGVEPSEETAPVKKSKRKKAAKEPQPDVVVEEKAEQVELEVGQVEEAIVTHSQTHKKYGWMVGERSAKNRKYFVGKGSRY